MEDKKNAKKRLCKVSGLLLCNKSVKIRLIELFILAESFNTILSELELCPTCKKGKLRTTEEDTGELVYDYCGQKCSDEGLNEYV